MLRKAWPHVPGTQAVQVGGRKAEGGLAWVTRVGRVMEWIWPWSLQPAGPPQGTRSRTVRASTLEEPPHWEMFVEG